LKRWLASTRAARGIAPACVRKSAALWLDAGVCLARPLRHTRAPAGMRNAWHEGRLSATRDAANDAQHRGAPSQKTTTSEHQRRMVGTGLTLVLGCARSPPAHPLPCTKPPRHEGRPQEHKARRAHGAWHGGASRGSPRFDEQSCNTMTCYRERLALRPRMATVPSSHRCGVTRRPSMEKRRRDVHGARRLEGAPTGKIKEGNTTQKRVRLRVGSRRVGDVVVAGLTKKAARCRCSRRHSTSCSVPAPLRRGRLLPLPRRLVRPSPLWTRTASGFGTPTAPRTLAPLPRSSSPSPSPSTPLLPR
jgi:hypothetical protein